MRYSAAGAARDIPLCLPNYQRLSMPDYLSLQSTAFARLERVACALDPDRATAQPRSLCVTTGTTAPLSFIVVEAAGNTPSSFTSFIG